MYNSTSYHPYSTHTYALKDPFYFRHSGIKAYTIARVGETMKPRITRCITTTTSEGPIVRKFELHYYNTVKL